VPTLFRGDVQVAYAQAYVQVGEDVFDTTDLQACFAGQDNGLCGAGVPGGLFLVTGLHTGSVPFDVEAHEADPGVPDREDVVEVSLSVPGGPVLLLGWAGESTAVLDLPPGTYRVRYCADGMDAGRAADVRTMEEPPLDSYLLQFWPAPHAADQVVRTGSKIARYWHRHARGLPSAAAVTARRTRTERPRQREAEEAERRYEEWLVWRGRRPAGPLGNVPAARPVADLDRSLAEAIAATPPDLQRALARWTARRTLVEAGMASLDWVAAALDALDADRPLPPPFDDLPSAFTMLMDDPRTPRRLITSPDGQSHGVLQQAMALPVLDAAAHPESLVAVFTAVHHGAMTFGSPGYRAFFAELRHRLEGR
jgi:hypothetical protein